MGESIDKLLKYVKDNNIIYLNFLAKDDDDLLLILIKDGPEAHTKALRQKPPRSEEMQEKIAGELYQLLTADSVDLTNQNL